MDQPNRRRVDDRPETQGVRGCRCVQQDIEALDRGEDLPETCHLSSDERRLLIGELKRIMAVYAGPCLVR